MEKVLLKIQTTVPTTIFEVPKIKMRVDTLFTKMEADIKSRFDEIKQFLVKDLGENNSYYEISFDDVGTLFKLYFYKSVLNDVVEMTFSENGKHDVIANILEVLSEEKVKVAIMGEPMIYAFEQAMIKLERGGWLSPVLRGSDILLLEHKFLGKRIPGTG